MDLNIRYVQPVVLASLRGQPARKRRVGAIPSASSLIGLRAGRTIPAFSLGQRSPSGAPITGDPARVRGVGSGPYQGAQNRQRAVIAPYDAARGRHHSTFKLWPTAATIPALWDASDRSRIDH